MSDLVLQAIVRPTDAPTEIRAAVADALAGREDATHTWEDVSFAASAVALADGANALETHWVFALRAEQVKLGQRVLDSGSWSVEISGPTHWRARLYDAITTEPREQPAAS